MDTLRNTIWSNIDDYQWYDWKWQMSNRVQDELELKKMLNLTDNESLACGGNGLFKYAVTPYMLNIFDVKNANCPIRKQLIPTTGEFELCQEDPLAEEKQSPIPGLIHRCVDRVLLILTDNCACYCRHCTRKRLVGLNKKNVYQNIGHIVEYIKNDHNIKEVIFSGGDPLIYDTDKLELFFSIIKNIPHVDLIRVGTRFPVFNPMRIDLELINMLKKYSPIYINIQVNHPAEITDEFKKAISLFIDNGIPVNNQSVLLKGINDDYEILKELNYKLMLLRIRPYYLFQCDLVDGTNHFRTSIDKGLKIMNKLRENMSGYGIPVYVIDLPEGAGKIPLFSNMIVNRDEKDYFIKSFKGTVHKYPVE